MDSAGNAVTYDAPRVQIQTSRIRVRHRRATIRLKCQRGQWGRDCAGTLVLRATIHKRLGGRARRRLVTQTITVAQTTYSVADGNNRPVGCALVFTPTVC